MKHHFSKIFNHSEEEEVAATQEIEQERVQEIEVSLITPNQYQPRSVFDEEKLHELAATIDEHGVIQPIVLRPLGDKYEIIAGERRWRAVSTLGWETIPAIIKPLDDDQSASIALIENLQREELTAIEEAMAYARLIDIHGLTQESLAEKLGRGQSTIANKLRLLKLPSSVQSAILEKKITERHARALIILKDPVLQEKVLHEIIDKQLNVKQTENRVKRYLEKSAENKADDEKKSKRFSLSRDSRIAVNTIRQSVHMVTDSGLDIDTNEEDMGDYYQFTIRIPKHK
ncbi:nucleoid occlusion protein [Sporolactobacillus laevolacticus]|uniref:Chromosome partitioning protein ParB n=1 Tax=Sporolactobacillus laevolacticus DSM 442 TaxID=1395513 RepID=V6ITZ5_9BACL|nr:nucleoid occlusion protein [Sporolactobacillus laevolacticus]EST10458.1 chromosome partitioning protein ParB [Sporolactobacillus laevolacticus DSM 442]